MAQSMKIQMLLSISLLIVLAGCSGNQAAPAAQKPSYLIHFRQRAEFWSSIETGSTEYEL